MFDKQKSLYSESAADQVVIQNLLHEISKLKGELPMSKIIKSVDGKFYVVHNYEELTVEDATTLLDQFKAEQPLLEEVVNSAAVEAPAEDESQEVVPAPAPTSEPVQVVDNPIAPPAPGDAPVPVETPPAPAEATAPVVNDVTPPAEDTPAPVVLQ